MAQVNLRDALMAEKRKPTAKDYVQDGLISQFDAIENAGFGINDTTATTWLDLLRNVPSESIGTRTWGSDYLSTTGNFAIISSNDFPTVADCQDFEKTIKTIEAVFSTESTDVQCVVISLYSRKVIGSAETSLGVGTYQAVAAQNVASGKRWYAAATYSGDGGTASAGYVDGVAGTLIGGNFSNPTASSIYVGGRYSRPFTGRVCAIRFYNRELTAQEIAANYAIDKTRFGLP